MKHTTTSSLRSDLIAALAADITKMEGEMARNQIFQYFLVQEIKKRIRKEDGIRENILVHSQNNDRETALAKAEEKIGMALQGVKNGEGSDEGDGRAKYKNIESLLKYVENPNDKGQGVKLVIMNFND